MGTRDIHMDYIRKRKYWNTLELGGLITAPHTLDETFDEGKILTNPTDETVHQQEVGALAIVGVNICEGPTDDGNFFYGWRRCPNDVNPNWPIGFRIHWSQASAVTDGTTFILKFGVDKVNAAFQAVTLAALDIPLAESNTTGAWHNNWTSRGIKNSIGLTRAEIEAGAVLRFNIEADLVDTGQDKVTILGLEMDYVPMLTQGGGRDGDCPLQTDGVS